MQSIQVKTILTKKTVEAAKMSLKREFLLGFQKTIWIFFSEFQFWWNVLSYSTLNNYFINDLLTNKIFIDQNLDLISLSKIYLAIREIYTKN